MKNQSKKNFVVNLSSGRVLHVASVSPIMLARIKKDPVTTGWAKMDDPKLGAYRLMRNERLTFKQAQRAIWAAEVAQKRAEKKAQEKLGKEPSEEK